MNDLIVIGLNHRSAAVDVRERFAFTPAQQAALRQLVAAAAHEHVVLCTCNRSEIIFLPQDPADATETRVRAHFLAAAGDLSDAANVPLYQHRGSAALAHIFRVAAGLDSLVPGETQITGQLKDAFEVAATQGYAAAHLQRVYQRMLHAAKQVRHQTALGEGAVSVSSVAVSLARSIFDRLEEQTVLLLGAGEMSELAGRHFLKAGVTKLVIANRSAERGQALATELGGSYQPLTDLPRLLGEADIVLAATGSPTPLITVDLVRDSLRQRRGKPLSLIDIALPRDIEPKVNTLADVYLYNLDDLQRLVNENLRERQTAAAQAEGIIADAVREFEQDQPTAIGPLISSLQQRAATLKQQELAKLFRQHPDWSEAERQQVTRTLDLVVSKLLHDPIISLRRAASGEPAAPRPFSQLFREFFNLQ